MSDFQIALGNSSVLTSALRACVRWWDRRGKSMPIPAVVHTVSYALCGKTGPSLLHRPWVLETGQYSLLRAGTLAGPYRRVCTFQLGL